MGVRNAMRWVKEKFWHNAVLEIDSLTVVQSIRSSSAMLYYFGSVIMKCNFFLQDFPNVSILFIRRFANSVAHFFARASYYIVDRVIRRGDISPEFRDVILKDCL